jgi:predicted PurR-regulated permease PerM
MFGLKRRRKDDLMEVTVSNSTVVRVLVLAMESFIFLLAVRQAKHSIILILTAFFLALALNSPVHWLSQRLPGKRRGNRKLATGLSFLIIIALLAAFLASIVPPLVRQTSTFIDAAPRLIEDARSENSGLGHFIRRYHLQDQTDKLSNELGDRLGNIGGNAVTGIGRVGSSIFSTLTILVLTFMMLIEGPRWIAFSKRLIPNAREAHLDRIGEDMYRVVTGFVNGQVTLAALAATLILVPLFAFHVSYPIALFVIVFICGLIIVCTVALFHSPLAALGMLIYYVTYQQIENYVLQPRIQANSTNMSPLLVFSSVIIGVNFGGLFGGLVAIPLAGCLRIVVLDYLETRNLLSKAEVAKVTHNED